MYYFAKFDETGEVESISISEFKTEEETEFAYYIPEEECLKLKQQIAEKIKADTESEVLEQAQINLRITELEEELALLKAATNN